MNILNPNGATVSSGTAPTREHSSEKVMQLRKVLSDGLEAMQQAWRRDMMPDSRGATEPNEPAISEHYRKEYASLCDKVASNNEPLSINREAMATWIKEELERRERDRQQHTPLHQLTDLEPMGFKRVGMHRGGPLWLSTECAVWMPTGGDTHVWLRGQHQRAEVFAEMLSTYLSNPADLQHPDYLLGELLAVLRNMRRERPSWPAEAWLQNVRKDLIAPSHG